LVQNAHPQSRSTHLEAAFEDHPDRDHGEKDKADRRAESEEHNVHPIQTAAAAADATNHLFQSLNPEVRQQTSSGEESSPSWET